MPPSRFAGPAERAAPFARPGLPPDKTARPFRVVSPFEPRGDQQQAIAQLAEGLERGDPNQVLLGVTGSGKTYSVARVIEAVNRPALVMAHNKTLAAQLYQEFRSFFPDNAVEYFVSYYDYYQPEAYVPASDTYIEKEATINDEIDRLRLSATRSLFERRDVLIVASVSCIYGLGSPEAYYGMLVVFEEGAEFPSRQALLRKLVEMQYERNDASLERGRFRVRGDTVEIVPGYEDLGLRVRLYGDEVERLARFDPLTGRELARESRVTLFPRTHYVAREEDLARALVTIREELDEHHPKLLQEGKLLEAQRLMQRTLFDLDMLAESGHCHGIENYSRHFTGRAPGEPPPTLMDYLPPDALIVVDESHQTYPQVRGMFAGDQARKRTLVEHGFRLPSALDNRPLSFAEWGGAGRTGDLGFGDPGAVRTRGRGRGGGRTDHPSHRFARSRGRGAARGRPGGRPARRNPGDRGPGRAGARHHPDQADGRGPHRVLPRARGALPLPALGHRHAGAGAAPALPPPGRVRRADRDQPVARGARFARGLPGGHPRCRPGGISPARRGR